MEAKKSEDNSMKIARMPSNESRGSAESSVISRYHSKDDQSEFRSLIYDGSPGAYPDTYLMEDALSGALPLLSCV